MRDVRLVDEREQRVANLAEIVRRDIGRHADCDAVRAVDEQIRKLRRQDVGLRVRAVEVRDEIDRVLVDVGEHPLGQPRQLTFGVSIRGGRIAVDRTEISLTVDQQVAEAERLRHADQRIVNRHVAVRMVPREHLAHDRRALGIAPVREQPGAEHRVQNAAMHGLEAVANLRQRAPDIHRHRVVQVGLTHIVFDIQQRGFVAMRFVTVGFSHLNSDSHEFPELAH